MNDHHDFEWAVFRLDYAGNQFLVKKGLSEFEAHRVAKEFESHGHHHHYWVQRFPEASVDYTEMLRKLLDHGSSLESSLKVLLAQNASEDECVEALCKLRELSREHAKQLVCQTKSPN